MFYIRKKGNWCILNTGILDHLLKFKNSHRAICTRATFNFTYCWNNRPEICWPVDEGELEAVLGGVNVEDAGLAVPVQAEHLVTLDPGKDGKTHFMTRYKISTKVQ